MKSDLKLAERYVRTAQSAKSRGFDFRLSFIQFKNLLSRRYCPYSGVELTDASCADNQATLDRIDSTRGYVKGNVIACSSLSNSKKGNLSTKEILNMAKTIKQYEGK